MIIHLYDIVRPIHIDLNFMLLEFFEFILIEMIGEGTFCAPKVATENKEFIITSLMEEASVDRGFLTHRI